MINGDEAAFRQLVAEYEKKVYSTALNMVSSEAIAQDIAQEVFITIFRSIASFNQNSSLSTWIYRITVNKCLDHIRSTQRKKRFGFISIIFQGGEETKLEHNNTTNFIHPGILAENREKASYLYKAIERLPENQKTIFILAHIEELPQKQIADIMNMSLKAVESTLQRAKANLRKILSDYYNEQKK